MPRSQLSETYDRLMSLVGQLLGLNEEERNFVLDRVAPLPEPEKKPTKRTSKKSNKSASKSARGQSISSAIRGTASRTITGPACSTCGNVEDHPDHDTAHYLSAHEFDAGKSPAPPARVRSSTNGGGDYFYSEFRDGDGRCFKCSPRTKRRRLSVGGATKC